MEPFELGREVQNVLKSEKSELKELLMKLAVKYKLSEEKRKALAKKITNLKEDCRIHSDKLLNSERNRLLAEYNLFMSEKKIRKLEKRVTKLMEGKKYRENDNDQKRDISNSKTSLTHMDEELTGHVLSKESNNADLIGSSISPSLPEEQADLKKCKSYQHRDFGCTDFPENVKYRISSPVVSNTSQRPISPQQLSFRDSEILGDVEKRFRYPDIKHSEESLKTRQEELDKLQSRLQVLRSVSVEKTREIQDRKTSIKEKERMVNNVKEEIAKIREIMKLKSGIF